MKQFLISCKYEEYCQGWEDAWGYWLVTAISFKAACEVLKDELRNPHDFCNHTLGE